MRRSSGTGSALFFRVLIPPPLHDAPELLINNDKDTFKKNEKKLFPVRTM